MITSYQIVTGTGEAVEATEDVTVIAAQGSNKKLHLMRGVLSVTLAATGGGGEAAVEDGVGGTRIIEVDADALGFYPFDFGDEGIPLSANTILNLTVDGAVTNQASARLSAVCKVVG